jgi:ComF family protein
MKKQLVPHFKNWSASLWRSGLNMLFPPVCAACDKSIEGFDPIQLCALCRAELTRKKKACCPRCGDWNISTAHGKPRCASCARHKVHFEQAAFLGTYETALRTAVLKLKHPGNEALALALSELSVQQLAAEVGPWLPDLIVPVPMHWRRKWSRGVSGPEILGEVWSRRLRLPQEPGLLIRRRNTLPQADLLPVERFRNVRDAFRVSVKYRLRGAKILLVDDILTTGATCHEAALTLCRAGAKGVFVVAFARAG